MVTVAGLQTHVLVSGAGPTVVLCGGLGSNWFDWDDCARILSAFHTVVVFDRPGFGASDPYPTGQACWGGTDETPNVMAETPSVMGEADRILGVLDALDLLEPAVIVGHSIAGFYAEAFARVHPHRTAGLLLLDSSAERDPWRLVPRRIRVGFALSLAELLTRSGLQNLLGPTSRRVLNHSIPPDGIPIETYDAIATIYRTPSYLRAALVENFVYPDMAAELNAIRRRTTVSAPVTVAAAHTGRPTPWARAWLAKQQRLAHYLNARFTVVGNAHHHAMIDQPAVVSALIGEVVSHHRSTDT